MLAHQGGWDEILLVLGPMLVIVVLLRLAKHRVERLQPDDDTARRLREEQQPPPP